MTVDYEGSRRLYEEGRRAMESRDFRTAIEKFRRSVEVFPHFKTLELLGECLLLDDDLVQAITYLAAAAGLGKKQTRARFLLAKALLAVWEDRDAIEKLKEALVIEPNYKSARDLLDSVVTSDDDHVNQ